MIQKLANDAPSLPWHRALTQLEMPTVLPSKAHPGGDLRLLAETDSEPAAEFVIVQALLADAPNISKCCRYIQSEWFDAVEALSERSLRCIRPSDASDAALFPDRPPGSCPRNLKRAANWTPSVPKTVCRNLATMLVLKEPTSLMEYTLFRRGKRVQSPCTCPRRRFTDFLHRERSIVRGKASITT